MEETLRVEKEKEDCKTALHHAMLEAEEKEKGVKILKSAYCNLRLLLRHNSIAVVLRIIISLEYDLISFFFHIFRFSKIFARYERRL